MDIEQLVGILGRWTAGGGPLYRRLASAIQVAIQDGTLLAGDALPAERVLATRLSVSRTTVVSAYEALRESGLVSSRQGSGTWVSPPAFAAGGADLAPSLPREPRRPSGAFFKATLEPSPDVIDLSLACVADLSNLTSADLAVTPDDLRSACAERGYAPQGLPVLRDGLAELYRAAGLPTTAEQIVVTSGAQQAIALVGAALVDRAEPVLIDTPTYPGALDAFARSEARLIGVPVTPEGIDADAFAEAASLWRPRIAYLIPAFNNPTGAATPGPALDTIADAAARERVLLVEDDATGVIPVRGDLPPFGGLAVRARGAVCTIGSLSKIVWPGLRVGWVRAPREVAARLVSAKIADDLGCPAAEQVVACRLLPTLDERRRRLSVQIRERLAVLLAELGRHLPEWEPVVPDGGVTVWIRLPGADAQSFVQVAMRHGVAIVAGTSMSVDGGHADHVRVALTAQPPDIAEAVARLAAAWDAYRRPRTAERPLDVLV